MAHPGRIILHRRHHLLRPQGEQRRRLLVFAGRSLLAGATLDSELPHGNCSSAFGCAMSELATPLHHPPLPSPLQVAADRRLMNDATVQRLQHGFFWFALLVILLHLVHLLFVKSLNFWGLLIGEHARTPGSRVAACPAASAPPVCQPS